MGKKCCFGDLAALLTFDWHVVESFLTKGHYPLGGLSKAVCVGQQPSQLCALPDSGCAHFCNGLPCENTVD